jgi:hypothetical protein
MRSKKLLDIEGQPVNQEHRIDIEQNKPERLELLRAQRLFYARAKLYQSRFTVTALMLPAIGLLFGTQYPAIRPYLGIGSIALLLLEVGLISPMQRTDCKRGAKVQEQFDTEVLRLNWNKLVAGGRVDAEEVRAITLSPMTDAERVGLENWYEVAISKLPLPLGRLLCQRTNLAYDIRVRKVYANICLGAATLLLMVLAAGGVQQGLKVDELILTMCLPTLPLLSYVLRGYRKQQDTIETLNTMKTEVEKVWEKALAGASTEELTANARALQDSIYRHRTSDPLVFDWLYDWLRKRLEDITRHGIERLVAEAQQKLNLLRA